MAQRTIRIEEARALYGNKINAIRYTSVHGAEVVVFEVDNLIVQVNTHKTGRKEAFTTDRCDLVSDLFDVLDYEDDAERL